MISTQPQHLKALKTFLILFRDLTFVMCLLFSKQLSAQCSHLIDLNQWSQAGALSSGNWTVQGGGNSVHQSINGAPTFFISPQDFINVNIKGKIRVNDISDDDFIGFVFGLKDPLGIINTPNSFHMEGYLFDWKKSDQMAGNNPASAGYALSHVNGVQTIVSTTGTSFWHHNNTNTFNVLATNFGPTKGWTPYTDHDFELYYTSNRVVIKMDGDTIFDHSDCFDAGRFGFYNYSQSNVVYSDFEYSLLSDFSVDVGCLSDTTNFSFFNPSCFSGFSNSVIADWSWSFGTGDSAKGPNPSYIYHSPGQYNVELVISDSLGCTDTTNQLIQISPPPIIDLGPDKNVCAGESTALGDMNDPSYQYQWSDSTCGDTNVCLVNAAGTYYVTVVDQYGCSNTDSITIRLDEIQVDLGNDTSICEGNAVIFEANVPNASFVWNTGATQPNILATEAGLYIVSVKLGSCSVRDTVELGVTQFQEDFLPEELTVCNDSSFYLDASSSEGSSFLWDDGSTSPSILVNGEGLYKVLVSKNGCIIRDSTLVKQEHFSLDLGEDFTICSSEIITLGSNWEENGFFRW
ncbi:MAG: PKD domain-containing protein, partial [Flavobacteriales bacterium]|nr:PKD domain-containing protein [Flavobacteriales bacterium]